MKIVLLHSNDLHGHLTPWLGFHGSQIGKALGGVACLACAINQVRAETDAVLLLDAGDLIGDTMIADLTKGEALITAFNRLGYDAMTFGNHEPDFGVDILCKRMEQAAFPFVAANLLTEGGKTFAPPYAMKRVGGIAVGILGLTYPKTPWTTAAKNVTGLTFDDPISAVERALPKLRDDGAELIVVLSHLGLSGDKHLAEAVDGIHVIVGGHSHNRMQDAERVGETLIVQAGAHGSDLGRLDLTVEDTKITAHKHTLIPLEHETIPPDDAVAQLVEQILSPHTRALNEQLGMAADWLIRAQTVAGQEARKRDKESPVDSLFADIVRIAHAADFSFLPGVGYGVAIPPGPIVAAQLRQLVPHDGKLVTMALTGTQIREVLEQAVDNVFTADPKLKVGGMIQISGLRFRYDPAQQRGKRVTRIEYGENGVEPDATYKVVTNSMLANGGHNQQTFRQGRELQEHGSQYEAIKTGIAQRSSVRAPAADRIVRVSAPTPE